MTNCADNFEPSSFVMQQKKYIMMPRLILRPRQPGIDINTYFRPLVEYLKVLWYNNGVHVRDEHNRVYF
jgi:hypothetical protein